MPTTRAVRPLEPGGERHELVQLVRQIQTLTLELHELRQHEGSIPELHAKERTLEQLRWRLAATARRTASWTPPRDDHRGVLDVRTDSRPARSWLSVRHSLHAVTLPSASEIGPDGTATKTRSAIRGPRRQHASRG